MDFVRYAEASALLVSTELADVDSLRGHLAGRERLADRCGERDVVALRRFQGLLRGVYEASDRGDVAAVVEQLNALLEQHPIVPRISDHSANLHLHVATKDASVSTLLISEALLGLANLVCDLGATRLGVCSAASCDNVYVDTSPNQSRRYCSDRCSSRANVAAYRARQRAAAG